MKKNIVNLCKLQTYQMRFLNLERFRSPACRRDIWIYFVAGSFRHLFLFS